MATINMITGVKQVLAKLAAREAEIGAGTARGLKAAGLMLQRESQRLVPVNMGVLKASAFTRVTGTGLSTQVNVGYTAAYALFVHENVEMKLKGQPRSSGKGNYWDPAGRGQSKFLEEPARRLAPQLRQVIQSFAKVKL